MALFDVTTPLNNTSYLRDDQGVREVQLEDDQLHRRDSGD